MSRIVKKTERRKSRKQTSININLVFISSCSKRRVATCSSWSTNSLLHFQKYKFTIGISQTHWVLCKYTLCIHTNSRYVLHTKIHHNKWHCKLHSASRAAHKKSFRAGKLFIDPIWTFTAGPSKLSHIGLLFINLGSRQTRYAKIVGVGKVGPSNPPFHWKVQSIPIFGVQ